MKKFHRRLVLGGLLLGSVGLSATVHADVDSSTDRSGKTDVTATFSKPEMQIPTKPGGHKDADKPATGASDLALLYVPESFTFNEKINPAHDADMSVVIDDNSGAKKYRVGVGDVRGTNAGWKLTATLSELKEDSTKLPDGTKLILGKTELSSFPGTTGSPVLTKVETTDYDTQLNPTVSQVAVELPANGSDAKEIATANTGKGSGYWDIDLSAISLSVPDSKATPLKAGTYTGTVTWTLADTPI